jgi:hypothetical protein
MKLSESIKSNFKDFGLTEEESKIPGIDKKFDYEKQTIDKLNRSEKFDEIDTVAFGLETDDRKIVKVYVNAENADAFEEALSRMLGEKDDIEEILNDLSKDFDIVDVDWPEQDQEENTEDEQQEDGSEIMDKKVYKNDEVKETLGDQLAQKIFESGNTIETRFSTPTQLMVYHAILDLGVPEIVLNKSSYRAAIVKGIRERAAEIQSNSAMKNALKTFIKRVVDFEEMAKENQEQEDKKQQQQKEDVVNSSITINEDRTDWDFSMSKGEDLTIKCPALEITLDSEETEKVVKGVTNRDAVVVKDVDDQKKKVVFSPRGTNVLVKRVGSAEGYMMSSKDVDDLLSVLSPEKEKVEESTFKFDFSKPLVDNFETWLGSEIKVVGRNVIKGYPVDIDDSDGTFLEMTAVDADAAKGLMKIMRAAGFIVKIARGKELSVDMPAEVSESYRSNLVGKYMKGGNRFYLWQRGEGGYSYYLTKHQSENFDKVDSWELSFDEVKEILEKEGYVKK